MQIDWLTKQIPEGDDVVTVTFDATQESEQGTYTVLTRWRDLRRGLEADGVEAQTLDHVEEQIRVPTHVPGPHGRVIVAGPNGAVVDRVLADPPAVDSGVVGLDVTSLAQVADGSVRFLLVEIDRNGADMSLQQHAAFEYENLDEPATVEGGHDVVNKVRRQGMAHRRIQARAQDSWERNADAVAAELDRIVTRRRPELLLLTGDVRAVSLVRDRLGKEAAELATVLEGGSRSAGVNAEAFDRELHESLDMFRARRREEILDRFRQEEGRDGAATTGVEDVADTLARGQVEELILGEDVVGPTSPLASRTLWVGESALQIGATREAVADFGVSEPHELRADLAIGRAAAEQGAGVTVVDEASVELPDGVGAILRWHDAATPSEHAFKESGDTSRV